MSVTPLNIVLRLPENVAAAAVAQSSRLGEAFSTHYTLKPYSQKSYHPHISFYLGDYAPRNLPEVVKCVHEIARLTKPWSVNFTIPQEKMGWIGVANEFDSTLAWLQWQIVTKLNPLRASYQGEAPAEPYMQSMEDFSEYYNKWFGRTDILRRYWPHLTLTRLQNEADTEAALASIDWPFTECRITEMGVYEMQEHGTTKHLVELVSLTV